MTSHSNSKQGLVSIIIPTWQRIDLLMETIEHILKQTYHSKEIIVVCDGQDKELWQRVEDKYHLRCSYCGETDAEVQFISLGRNWSGLDRSSFGIAPLLVGYLCAPGSYIMPWCDDERALSDSHIEKLVYEIELERLDDIGIEYYADFVYPMVKIWRNGNPNGPETAIIGTEPPVHGQITHYLFRPENFVKFGYPEFGTHPVDWALIDKWIQNGATYSMIDEVTFSHRLDQ